MLRTTGPLPRGARRKGALRELLPQGLPPVGAARDLDPLHGPQALGAGAAGVAVVHALRRRTPTARCASKVTTPDVSAPEGTYIRIGDSTFEDGRVAGSGEDRAARRLMGAVVRLRARTRSSTCRATGCTARRCRRRSCSARTRTRASTASSAPGEREVAVDGWRGMVGHNWGTQHAERWIWLHGAGFEGADDVWLDAAIGRIKLGLVTTPWIANGTLYVGRRAPSPRRPGEGALDAGDREPDAVRLPAAGRRRDRQRARRVRQEELRRLGVRGPRRPRAQHGQLLDRGHDADAHRRRASPTASYALRGGAAYELGMREKDHGMPLQPFPDG